MKGIIKGRGEEKQSISWREHFSKTDQLQRQVTAIYLLLASIYGSDKLVMKAGKLDALKLMRSKSLEERVLALQRLVYEDPTLEDLPATQDIPVIINDIQDEIADIIARKTIEERIEKKIAERMQQRHEEYIKEVKMQVLKEVSGPDNPHTLKKYADLEKLEAISLSRSALEMLRPASLGQVVGQAAAVRALLAKVASPFPQHVIVYGPPGVGKTTVARLVLEEAKKLSYTPFSPQAPFVEVDGTTLRWDPREVTNPLLGSVHDPIYQGARRDLADSGIPEPKPGLVTEAHGGILFIDEIGDMDPILLNKLLKVLEDKRVKFDSAYYDPSDPGIPKYIKKLFEEGAPADFILVAATTRDPSEISPALRSRCGEVYFEPLTPKEIQQIVREAAGRLQAELAPEIPEIISEYTIEGRKAVGILADAYGLAVYRKARTEAQVRVEKEDLLEVIRISRLSPHVTGKATNSGEIGKIFGLGVSGFIGSVLEIEAVVFPVEKGKGKLRFNETAGSMAKDSVFNATSVARLVTGIDLSDYDLHVNVVGGGKIDGPSAGAAITLALISSLLKKPLRQDVAVTGEVSIQGKIKAVGGIFEKIYGAKQAGVKRVFVPKENEHDIPQNLDGVEVKAVESIEELMEEVFMPSH
ncbi:MAG TPA: Lon family ATP-dependent protease [Bacillota bacterium]